MSSMEFLITSHLSAPYKICKLSLPPQFFCFSKYQFPLSICSGHKLCSFISFYFLLYFQGVPRTHPLFKNHHCSLVQPLAFLTCLLFHGLQNGLPAYTLAPPQSVLNTVARVVFSKPRHIKPPLFMYHSGPEKLSVVWLQLSETPPLLEHLQPPHQPPCCSTTWKLFLLQGLSFLP